MDFLMSSEKKCLEKTAEKFQRLILRSLLYSLEKIGIAIKTELGK
jgi:hypothetical protein